MLFSQVVQSSLPRIWQKMIGGYWLIVFRLAQSLRPKGRNRLFEERFLGTALHICIPGFGSATSSSWRHQAVETAPTLAKSLFSDWIRPAKAGSAKAVPAKAGNGKAGFGCVDGAEKVSCWMLV
jgi:hypothetical protein